MASRATRLNPGPLDDRMAIPPEQLAIATKALDVFCAKLPEHVRGVIEHTYRVETNSIILINRYRNPDRRNGAWSDEQVAKFRYYRAHELWDLYWMDRNFRWRLAEWRPAAKRFTTLLREVEKDRTCLFWG
jgi:Protein of unknown function (DUF3024)